MEGKLLSLFISTNQTTGQSSQGGKIAEEWREGREGNEQWWEKDEDEQMKEGGN